MKVPDPYRWLEDENSDETKAWMKAQNALTFAYLDKIPYREKLRARLMELSNYPRTKAPIRRGDTYFFSKNDGLQNQNVYYIQKGVNGKPEVFLDPNKFSADGTSTLSAFSLSKNGKYVAYGTSQGGSDWVTLRVMEVETRKVLDDELWWLKASGVSWQGDGLYPATLITTADHGDRVVPAPNFKYAAVLQAAQAGEASILIRIDANSAHGASSTTKSIEINRDVYAFLFDNLGVDYK